MIRLFAAIAVPSSVVEVLAPLQQGLRGARWRPPEALHITLRFFGDIDERTADDLDAELSAITAAPFDVALKGTGYFGEGKGMNAVWAGVEGNSALNNLAKRCEGAARQAGLKPEKRHYLPHLTLAYLRGALEPDLAVWLQASSLLAIDPFAVDRFGLYSSWQGARQSSYRLEREYLLG
ncbi:RNA 2',3'-cyclic phosphodiesterase [soil metagenome]